MLWENDPFSRFGPTSRLGLDLKAARSHRDVLSGRVTEETFDDLHEQQTQAAARARMDGGPGVICDTGDVVLRMWSEAVLNFSWHPLMPPNPSVDLYILSPVLETWEPDNLRTLPKLEDRKRLESFLSCTSRAQTASCGQKEYD